MRKIMLLFVFMYAANLYSIPAGYTDHCSEGGTFTSSSHRYYACYGTDNGNRWYYKANWIGTITYNNATFGDPAPGVVKRGGYRYIGWPSGYTEHGGEGSTYTNNNEVYDAFYGAFGNYYYLYGRMGSTTFNNATFGDPASGIAKVGGYKILGTPTHTPTMGPCGNIAYVASGSGSVSNGSSVSFSVNNTSSAPAMMLISVYNNPSVAVRDVAYGNSHGTQLAYTGISGNAGTRVFYISNLPSGTNTLTVTTSSNDYTIVTAVIYQNVGAVSGYQVNTQQWIYTVSRSITTGSAGGALVAFGSVRAGCNNVSWNSPTSVRLTKTLSGDRATTVSDLFNVSPNTNYTPSFNNACSSEVMSIIVVNLSPATYCLTSTVTPTITKTDTPVLTPTPTMTITATNTCTITQTITRTVTNTVTPTVTRTVTVTATPTATATITLTRTPTVTETITPTITHTSTQTVTPTVTQTVTPTSTVTPTITETFMLTPVVTVAVSYGGDTNISVGDTVSLVVDSYINVYARSSFLQAEVSDGFEIISSTPVADPVYHENNKEGYYGTTIAANVLENHVTTITAKANKPGLLNFYAIYRWQDYTGASQYKQAGKNFFAVSPTFTETYSATPTRTITVTLTETVTSTHTPFLTPTNTPQFHTSISTDHTQYWVVGDRVKVDVYWWVRGQSQDGIPFILRSDNSGNTISAGYVNGPVPNANITNASGPSLYWYVPGGYNPEGTYSYYYNVTSPTDDYISLRSYFTTNTNTAYAVSSDRLHYVITATATLTSTTAVGTQTHTPTNTPVFVSTETSSHEGDWVLGDIVDIYVNWELTGDWSQYWDMEGTPTPENSLYVGSKLAPGYQAAGYIDSYDEPGADVIDSHKPEIKWNISSKVNMQGTRHYRYAVTGLGTGYFSLETYLKTYSGEPFGVIKGPVHRIITSTPTITQTVTETVTPTLTQSVTDTVTQTATLTFTATVTQTMDYTATPSATLSITQKSYMVIVEYKAGNPETGKIKPIIRVVNTDPGYLDLQDLRIRYWYTSDGASSETASVLYAYNESVTITAYASASLASVSVGDQDRAIDITFSQSAGSLAPGGHAEFSCQVSRPSGDYNQLNDWSAGTHTDVFYSNGMINGYIDVNGDERNIFGQEPFVPAEYSLSVDCGGPGEGSAMQDRPYGYGGWGRTVTYTAYVYDYDMTIEGASAEEQELFRSSAIGSPDAPLSYVIDNIPDGAYSLTFRFAELRPWIKEGDDVFSIYANGVRIVSDIDVIKDAGGFAKAYTVTADVIVRGGSLSITFDGSQLAGFSVSLSGILNLGTKRWPAPYNTPQPTVPVLMCDKTFTFTPTITTTPTCTVTPQWSAAISVSSNPVVAGEPFTMWLNGFFSGNSDGSFRITGLSIDDIVDTEPPILGGGQMICGSCFHFYTADHIMRNGTFYDQVTLTVKVYEETEVLCGYFGSGADYLTPLSTISTGLVVVVSATATPTFTDTPTPTRTPTHTATSTVTPTVTPMAIVDISFQSGPLRYGDSLNVRINWQIVGNIELGDTFTILTGGSGFGYASDYNPAPTEVDSPTAPWIRWVIDGGITNLSGSYLFLYTVNAGAGTVSLSAHAHLNDTTICCSDTQYSYVYTPTPTP